MEGLPVQSHSHPRSARVSRVSVLFELLESRRLLSFTPFGHETIVPGVDPEAVILDDVYIDAAVAADGSYIVARTVQSGAPNEEMPFTNVEAVRYSSAGVQIG